LASTTDCTTTKQAEIERYWLCMACADADDRELQSLCRPWQCIYAC